MIKVVKTDVLWFDGRKRRVKKPGDVFEADPALEARLVSDGVAEYVGEGGEDSEAEEAGGEAEVETAAETEADGSAPEGDAESDLESMTKAELAEMAAEYGIAVGKKTKAELVEAILEADEKAPSLDAVEVEL